MEKNLLNEIDRIKSLMSSNILLIEDNPIISLTKEGVIKFAKYLDELIKVNDGNVDNAIKGLNLKDNEADILSKIIKDEREELIRLAKESSGSVTGKLAELQNIMKQVKLNDDVIDKIIKDVWNEYMEKDSFKTIHQGVKDIFLENIERVLSDPNAKTTLENLKSMYKDYLDDVEGFKGKEDFQEFLASKLDKDPDFIEVANRYSKPGKEQIVGFKLSDPNLIFPKEKLADISKNKGGLEKLVYKEMSWLPELAFKKLPAFDNFYNWVTNLVSEIKNRGRFGYDEIETETKEIVNSMLDIIRDTSISPQQKNVLLQTLQGRMINKLKMIQPKTGLVETLATGDVKLVNIKEVTALKTEIEDALRTAKSNSLPGAVDLYDYFISANKGNTLKEIESILKEVDKVNKSLGKQSVFSDILPDLRTVENEIGEESKQLISKASADGADLKNLSSDLKTKWAETKDWMKDLFDGPVGSILRSMWNNFRYGVTTDLSRMRSLFIKYGYIKGSIYLYLRLIFLQNVLLPVLETIGNVVVGVLGAGKDASLANYLLYLYPSNWYLDEESRQIAKDKIIDQLNSARENFFEEIKNKIIEDFSVVDLIPIGGFIYTSVTGDPNMPEEEVGLFNTYWQRLTIEPAIEKVRIYFFDSNFKFESDRDVQNEIQKTIKELESYTDKPLNELDPTGELKERKDKKIQDKKQDIDRYINAYPQLEILKKYYPIIQFNPNFDKKANESLGSDTTIVANPKNTIVKLQGDLDKYDSGLFDPIKSKFYPITKLPLNYMELVNNGKIITNLKAPSGKPRSSYLYIKDESTGIYYGLDQIQKVISEEELQKIINFREETLITINIENLNNYVEDLKKVNSQILGFEDIIKGYEEYKKTLDPERFKETTITINDYIEKNRAKIQPLIEDRKKIYEGLNSLIGKLKSSKIEKERNAVENLLINLKKAGVNVQNDQIVVENYRFKNIINKIIKEVNEGKKFGDDNFKHWKDTFKFKKLDEKTGQLKDVKITSKMDEIMDRIDHFRKKYDEDDSFVRAVVDVFGTGIDVIQYTKGLAHLTEGIIPEGLLSVLSNLRESKELVTWTVKHYKDGNWELVKGNFNKQELLNVGKTKRERDERQKESENPAEGLKKKEEESMMILKRDEKEGLNGLPTKVKDKVKEKLRQGWTTETPFDFLSDFYTESEINSVFNEKIKIYKLKPSLEFFRSLAKNSAKINLKKGFCKSLKNAEIEHDISQREKNVLHNFISKCESKFGV